jgi:hypothetical protein
VLVKSVVGVVDCWPTLLASLLRIKEAMLTEVLVMKSLFKETMSIEKDRMATLSSLMPQYFLVLRLNSQVRHN